LRPEKAHGFAKWLRTQFGPFHRPAGPAVITKHEPRPAAKGTAK
jgi:hypothetical protein